MTARVLMACDSFSDTSLTTGRSELHQFGSQGEIRTARADRLDRTTCDVGSMVPVQDYRHRSKGVFGKRPGELDAQ